MDYLSPFGLGNKTQLPIPSAKRRGQGWGHSHWRNITIALITRYLFRSRVRACQETGSRETGVISCGRITPISDSWVGGIGPKSLLRVADYTSKWKRTQSGFAQWVRGRRISGAIGATAKLPTIGLE
jgi:hypothetical protein